MTNEFNEVIFRGRVETCLERTRQVLDRSKHLSAADQVSHHYCDKYQLAEFLTHAAVLSYLNSLEKLGLSTSQIATLVTWAVTHDVSLRMEVHHNCSFVKEIKRDVDSATRHQTEILGFTTITSKSITTVTEFVFAYDLRYELVAFRGVGANDVDKLTLQTRSSSQEIIRSSKAAPYPETSHHKFEVNISWLMRTLTPTSSATSASSSASSDGSALEVSFAVDRVREDCHTPARNEQVHAAQTFFAKYRQWAHKVQQYFASSVFQVQLTHSSSGVRPDMAAINTEGVLVPVVPLFLDNNNNKTSHNQSLTTPSEPHDDEVAFHVSEGGSSQLTASLEMEVTEGESEGVVITASVLSQLIAEQRRSLNEKCDLVLSSLFPTSSSSSSSPPSPSSSRAMISAAEATLMVTLIHMQDVTDYYHNAIQFIENMLRKQLVAAVGKELQVMDFAAYMRFHNRRLLQSRFRPSPFSFAVRRSVLHSPEGLIRIEEMVGSGSGSSWDPIYPVSHCTPATEARPMQFALNASTNVTFHGDRHVHGFLAHSFSGERTAALRLTSQARQFSSFIVLVGRIVSATEFDPKYGFIVQNKDEVVIPLELEQIPTPKEFRDAIESLSPEQQRFATAFRSMQLESTLFGILVLQIKPQLEKVLQLCPDSLTKEIRLTQDLMEMFIKYQIPSDLLSFEAEEERTEEGGGVLVSSGVSVSSVERLSLVKRHVKAMQEMIGEAKNREIEEKKEEALYADPFCQAQPQLMMMSAMGGSMGGGPPPPPSARRSLSRMSYGSCPPPSCAPMSCASVSNSMVSSRSSSMIPLSASSASSFSSATTTSASTSLPSSAPTIQSEGGKRGVESNDVLCRDGKRNADVAEVCSGGVMDMTKMPRLLEAQFEKLDPDSSMRPTIINPAACWTKKSQKALLSAPVESQLRKDEQGDAKNAAFDLLDALSRSGALVMETASLHVVIAATQCFDKSLMDTVVQNNVNPIERVERSTLIMASTLHNLAVSDMLDGSQLERVQTFSPSLF